MVWFTGSMVLLVVTLCVSSAQEKPTLEVVDRRETISSRRGSSVKLSCNVLYDFKLCGLLQVVWYHVNEQQSVELTDPNKYLTTVSETISDDNRRHRLVETEILDVTPEDDGQFQCKAKCESGETVMGHFKSITVKD